MYATDGPRRARRFPAFAFVVAFALAGCILNPKTDDPNVESAAQAPRGAGGTTSASGGPNSGFAGLPGQLPPPGGSGAGGTIFGGSDGGIVGAGGTGPVVLPDASIGRDAGPADAGDAGDAGDARPDRHPVPTRD